MSMYWIVFWVMVAICFIFYLLKRIWGIDILTYVIQSRPVLIAISAVVQAVANIQPSKYLGKILDVLKAASEGAKVAEELWLMGDLEKEERNIYAKQLAHAILNDSGIEITKQIEVIINGIIEVVCVLLPHGVKPIENK